MSDLEKVVANMDDDALVELYHKNFALFRNYRRHAETYREIINAMSIELSKRKLDY